MAWSSGQGISGMPFSFSTINNVAYIPVMTQQYDASGNMAYKAAFMNTSSFIELKESGGSVSHLWIAFSYQTAA